MQILKRSLHFNGIIVIQRLDQRFEPTAKDLFEEVIEPAAKQRGLHADFVKLHSGDELLPLLDEIAAACEKQGLRPLIHIEMHGGRDGLVPEEGQLISWAALRPRLQRINAATGMNLLVTLATCYGAHLVETIHPDEPAPFWGLIGPSEITLRSEVDAGFRAFYASIIEQGLLWAAFEALCAETYESMYETKHWMLYMAEIILALGFGRYYRRQQGPGARKRSELEMVKMDRKRRRNAERFAGGRGGGTPTPTRAQIREQLREHHRSAFSRYKERFLMLDAHPENMERFPLTMEDALAIYEADEVGLHAPGGGPGRRP